MEGLYTHCSHAVPACNRATRLIPWAIASLLFFCMPAEVIAQENTIQVKGKVTDESNIGLAGVSVKVNGTQRGVATDKEGQFTINAPANSSLSFSFVSYTTSVLKLGTTDQTVAISLVPSSQQLSEVVVGYGRQRKRDVTGSVSSIKAADIINLPQRSIDQMLQGKVSGVSVSTNSGAPGGAVSVRIRGITTISGNNEPLYVIDGVPVDDNDATFNSSQYDQSGGQTKSSPLSQINPNDIVSVDILKDASATAIYGSRGSNGVVLITTKRGKEGAGKINYDFYTGQQRISRYLDVLNLRDYAEFSNKIADINGSSRNPEFQKVHLLGSGTDWQREIFQTANIMNHQLSFSGGGEKSKYYISGGYYQQDGIVIGSGFNRASARLNMDNNVRKWLKLGNSISVSSTREKQTLTENGSGVVLNALKQSPTVPVRFPDGSFGGPTININDPSGYNGVIGGGNPVAQAHTMPTDFSRQKLFGNVYAEISFLKHFTLRNEFGTDVNFAKQSRFTPTYKWGAVENTISSSSVQENKSFFYQVSNYLTYKNRFASNHDLTILAGHEASKSKWEWLQGFRSGFVTNVIPYLSAGDASTATNSNGAGHYSLESYFGRINYAFKDRYLLTATLRADGSSRFGPNNKWGYFPSAALAWNLGQEAFMQNMQTSISDLKIRLGWGAVGNQNIGNYAYGSSLRTIPVDPNSFGNGSAFLQNNISNADLKWESLVSLNLGIDATLFKTLTLSVDLYDKRSKDFLYKLPLPYYMGTGVPGQDWYGIQAPYVNTGEMQNKGIDVTLGYTLPSSKDFNWTSSLIFSKYENKILSLAEGTAGIYNLLDFNQTINFTTVGQPVGMFYGWIADGLFQLPSELSNHPLQSNGIDPLNGTYLGDIRFRNLDTTSKNGDQVIDGLDRTFIGNPHPKFTYGFTNNFSYKNIDLSFFIQGSYGAKILNYNRKSMEALSGRENQFITVKNFWTSENTNTTIPRWISGDPNNNNRLSSRYIEDGSFLRMQNITLGYTLPNSVLNKLRALQRLRIYGSVQNVFTLTKYTGYDPDLGAYNGDALRMSIDYGHYPIPRTYTAGINVEF